MIKREKRLTEKFTFQHVYDGIEYEIVIILDNVNGMEFTINYGNIPFDLNTLISFKAFIEEIINELKNNPDYDGYPIF